MVLRAAGKARGKAILTTKPAMPLCQKQKNSHTRTELKTHAIYSVIFNFVLRAGIVLDGFLEKLR
jgi:hypothetical protein